MKFLLTLRRRAGSGRGVIALMTLAFMVTAGMTMLVFLWGISRVTGAFNELYSANQAAAFAALTTTDNNSGAVASLKIDCDSLRADGDNPTVKTVCFRGLDPANHKALTSAMDVMEASLGTSPGNFGLCFDGTPAGPCKGKGEVTMLAEFPDQPVDGFVDPSIKVINLASNSAFPILCESGTGLIQGDIGIFGPSILCWRLKEYGENYSVQKNTGVITRAEAQVEYFPGCLSSLCPTATIRVSAAAAQDQPLPPKTYFP